MLLIDADLRRPGAHEIFDLPNTQGLTTLIRSDGARLGLSSERTEQADLSRMCDWAAPTEPRRSARVEADGVRRGLPFRSLRPADL